MGGRNYYYFWSTEVVAFPRGHDVAVVEVVLELERDGNAALVLFDVLLDDLGLFFQTLSSASTLPKTNYYYFSFVWHEPGSRSATPTHAFGCTC